MRKIWIEKQGPTLKMFASNDSVEVWKFGIKKAKRTICGKDVRFTISLSKSITGQFFHVQTTSKLTDRGENTYHKLFGKSKFIESIFLLFSFLKLLNHLFFELV